MICSTCGKKIPIGRWIKGIPLSVRVLVSYLIAFGSFPFIIGIPGFVLGVPMGVIFRLKFHPIPYSCYIMIGIGFFLGMNLSVIIFFLYCFRKYRIYGMKTSVKQTITKFVNQYYFCCPKCYGEHMLVFVKEFEEKRKEYVISQKRKGKVIFDLPNFTSLNWLSESLRMVNENQIVRRKFERPSKYVIPSQVIHYMNFFRKKHVRKSDYHLQQNDDGEDNDCEGNDDDCCLDPVACCCCCCCCCFTSMLSVLFIDNDFGISEITSHLQEIEEKNQAVEMMEPPQNQQRKNDVNNNGNEVSDVGNEDITRSDTSKEIM